MLEIVEVEPIDGSVGSGLSSTITATFNEQICSTSISSDSLIVKKVTINKIIL